MLAARLLEVKWPNPDHLDPIVHLKKPQSLGRENQQSYMQLCDPKSPFPQVFLPSATGFFPEGKESLPRKQSIIKVAKEKCMIVSLRYCAFSRHAAGRSLRSLSAANNVLGWQNTTWGCFVWWYSALSDHWNGERLAGRMLIYGRQWYISSWVWV